MAPAQFTSLRVRLGSEVHMRALMCWDCGKTITEEDWEPFMLWAMGGIEHVAVCWECIADAAGYLSAKCASGRRNKF